MASILVLDGPTLNYDVHEIIPAPPFVEARDR
jgi:hypothetical protein